jgi:uncharacterized protein
MVEKVVMFGGSGFLGSKLTNILRDDYKIVLATRCEGKISGIRNVEYSSYSDNIDSFLSIIEGADIVVNFSGASIAGRRWNEEYKKVMYNSRVNTTILISEAIGKCMKKPHTFVSTSATGIYGDRGDELLDESSEMGNDFLANLCKDWERSALKSIEYSVRTVCIRVGVVLDKKEGGFSKMVQPFRFFVGGPLGNGKQYLPWIHVNDLVNIYKEAITNKALSGIVNGTAPNPVTNREFSKTLGHILKRPGIFSVPKFALKLVVGEFAEFLTGSQRVFPKKLTEAGFRFEYKDIEQALINITD